MPNEIYHRSEWGNPKAEGFGDVYFDAAATNKLYNHSDYYENSDGTDKILRDISNKASIVLTPTAYSDGSLNTVIPPYQVLSELVTNGTFDTDSDWNKNNSWTISGGKANYNYISGRNLNSSTATLIVGRIYQIKYTISNYVSGSVENSSAETQISNNSNGTYTEVFTARYTFLRFRGSTNGEFSLDNVSVKEIQEADFDFSRGSSATRVNEKGLIEDVASGIPRIDYTSGTGALLLEPQSTNKVTYSEDFSDGSWTLLGSIQANSSSSPDGLTNATKFTRTDTMYNLLRVSASTLHVTSVFVKNIDANNFYIRKSGASYAYYNFDTKTVNDNSLKVEYFSNDWIRLSLSTDETSYRQFGIGQSETDLSEVGNSVYVWGAQLEQGSYATSYIPTEGSTVTRSADVANNSGNADLFNDSEGVLYAEIAALADDLTFRSISISSDAGYNNSIMIRYISTSNQVNVITRIGSAKNNISVDVNDITEFNKISFKYKSEDCVLFINGVQVATSAQAFNSSGINNLSFDRGDGAAEFYGNVKCVAVFKEALTDAALESLTSWVSFTEMATDLEYTLE
jgi:hypothetical protein